jgi:membrane protein implicated in regulation of membrane protease activity
MLVLRAFVASFARKSDRFAVAGAAAAFGVMAMMVFVNTLIGSGGMFFFIGVMLPVAGWRYAREMQQPVRHTVTRPDDQPGSVATGTVAQRNIALPSTLLP